MQEKLSAYRSWLQPYPTSRLVGEMSGVYATGSREESWEYSKELESDRSLAYSYASLSFFDETAVLSYYVELLDRPIHTLRVTHVPVDWFYH